MSKFSIKLLMIVVGSFVITAIYFNNRVNFEENKAIHADISYVLVRATRTMQITKYELENARIIIEAQEREINYLTKRPCPCPTKTSHNRDIILAADGKFYACVE